MTRSSVLSKFDSSMPQNDPDSSQVVIEFDQNRFTGFIITVLLESGYGKDLGELATGRPLVIAHRGSSGVILQAITLYILQTPIALWLNSTS